MNQVRQAAVPAYAHSSLPVRKHPVSLWIILALLLTLAGARAGVDDDYLNIYGIINQADSLNASGKVSQAHAKYLEAQRALTGFQKNNPEWNAKVVSYRISYLADKVAATSAKPGAEKGAAPPAAMSAVKLLAVGSDPKKALRLHPAAGDRQTITMTREKFDGHERRRPKHARHGTPGDRHDPES